MHVCNNLVRGQPVSGNKTTAAHRGLRTSIEQPPFPVLHSALPQIRFSTKSFGVDAAEVAARAIENIAGSLVDADMSDIIAGRPGACLGGCRRCWAAQLDRAWCSSDGARCCCRCALLLLGYQ